MKRNLYIILLFLISMISCQKEEPVTVTSYRYFIEWDSWKTGLHSCVIIGGENTTPRTKIVENGKTNEYYLLLDSRILDSFTTTYPNHVKNGQYPFYIKQFYKID